MSAPLRAVRERCQGPHGKITPPHGVQNCTARPKDPRPALAPKAQGVCVRPRRALVGQHALRQPLGLAATTICARTTASIAQRLDLAHRQAPTLGAPNYTTMAEQSMSDMSDRTIDARWAAHHSKNARLRCGNQCRLFAGAILMHKFDQQLLVNGNVAG